MAATSLDDVRARAHASKSQLYLYFRDRDDLLRAVAEATCEAVLDTQQAALAEFDSLVGAERYLDALVTFQEQREAPGGCPIGTLAGQLADHDEPSRLALAEGYARWEQGLCSGLEAMSGRGELRPDVDPRVLANQILAVLQGGLVLTQVRRDPRQLRAAADAALELVGNAATRTARPGGS